MSGTSWEINEIYNMVRAMCLNDTRQFLTAPSTISEETDNYVSHPLFGKTKRRGWASMKKGIEMCFSISYMLDCHEEIAKTPSVSSLLTYTLI